MKIWEFYPKRARKSRQKGFPRQNSVCLGSWLSMKVLRYRWPSVAHIKLVCWESNVILILVKLQASLAKSGNFLVTLVGVFVRLPLMIMVNTVLTRIFVFVTFLKREDSEREEAGGEGRTATVKLFFRIISIISYHHCHHQHHPSDHDTLR